MLGVGKGIVVIAVVMIFIVVAKAFYVIRRRPRGDTEQ